MKATKVKKKSEKKGRPLSFDPARALDQALHVFWEKGYEGASMADLTKAMGINKPSLYAAFGDKESLFRKALDRYAEGPAGYASEAMNAPTGRAVIERLVCGTVETLANPRNPKGCLLVQGSLAAGDEAECAKRELTLRRDAGESMVIKRLKKAKADGELSEEVDAVALAQFYVTVSRGMAVQAASGATRQELKKIADMALRAWPKEVVPT